METNLTLLPPGAEATVSGFTGDPARLHRLREMGLLKGTKIRFLRFAPLGDPLEIELRGYRLSLRKHEAENILVTVTNCQPPP